MYFLELERPRAFVAPSKSVVTRVKAWTSLTSSAASVATVPVSATIPAGGASASVTLSSVATALRMSADARQQKLDAQQERFLAKADAHVAMRVISSGALSPLGDNHRFAMMGRLVVRMEQETAHLPRMSLHAAGAQEGGLLRFPCEEWVDARFLELILRGFRNRWRSADEMIDGVSGLLI